MAMAADMSQRLTWIDAATTSRIERLLQTANLPIRAPSELSPQRFLEIMSVDKKVKQGKINLVLLKALGKAVVTSDYDSNCLDETLSAHPSSPTPIASKAGDQS